MSDLALWLKALHIMAFTAWMAGLWYLPRLFVYHSQVAAGSEASEKYKVMERRLLRGITTPAMVATIAARRRARHRAGPVVGRLAPRSRPRWSWGWRACTASLARYLKAFAADRRPASERFFRWLNELPTLLFVAIVLVVVFRPF